MRIYCYGDSRPMPPEPDGSVRVSREDVLRSAAVIAERDRELLERLAR
jgi:hypothetical protein